MKHHHGLSEKTLALVDRVFEQHPEVERAVLFGSRAKGNFRPGSDIDLALSGTTLTKKSLNRFYTEFDDLPIPYAFSLVVYDELTDPDVRAHIERVGTNFYERKP